MNSTLVRNVSSIPLIDPLDLHVHLRKWGREGFVGWMLSWLAFLLSFLLPSSITSWLRGGLLPAVLPYTANRFSAFTVMPNVPAIDNAEQLRRYRMHIKRLNKWRSRPLMTFKVGPKTTPEMVQACKMAGAIAGKLYPEGVTTGSEEGVTDFSALLPVFRKMEALGLILCFHGEMPGITVMKREIEFLHFVERVMEVCPRLKIVLEHITTEEAVCFVRTHAMQGGLIAATITVHHLRHTIDDLIGSRCDVHKHCQPVYKELKDRDALIAAALSGEKWFFFGSDTAPHLQDTKECAHAACGVFSAPIALEMLVQIFDEHGGTVEALRRFVCENGRKFYELVDLPGNQITLIRKPWCFDGRKVLQQTGVVPWNAGQELSWQIKHGVPLAT